MSTSTPWGCADHVEKYRRGIIWYSTPSHGGFHLCKTLNERVPPYMREPSGWYEEDCDWAIVATVFPDAFLEHEGPEKGTKSIEAAKRTLQNWHPDLFEKWYGTTLAAGESYIRDNPLPTRRA